MIDARIARALRDGPGPSASPIEREQHQRLIGWHAANPQGTFAGFHAELAREQFRADEAARAKAKTAETPKTEAPETPPKVQAEQRRARPRSDTDSKPPKREIWAYAPVPRMIIRDPRLTKVEKLVAVGIADAINPGHWNSDLHVDISHRAIAKRIGVNPSSVTMALEHLRTLGYITTEPMPGTAGTRVRFVLEALELVISNS